MGGSSRRAATRKMGKSDVAGRVSDVASRPARAKRNRKPASDPFAALWASPRAINFTAEQWAADLERRRAQWAAEDAGMAPPEFIYLENEPGRDVMAEYDAEHLERLRDPFYRFNIFI